MISLSQAMISLERLDRYMLSKELVEQSVERVEGCDGIIAVEVKDGAFNWDDESEDQVLKNINFEIKKGELTSIVGTVGSGKSSLLASVLGEMHKISGKISLFLPHRVGQGLWNNSLCCSNSWIQNGTIQENILFGLPMDKEKYNEVIRVCCLEKDLEMMDYGDQTEIGERGINLSGGQKQRIQLARAVYQDCDIYLLDDVFSAVDAHTGSDIFKECVRGALKGKTILLVTHQVDFLHNVDLIMGLVEEAGATIPGENSPKPPKSPHAPSNVEEANGENKYLDQHKSVKGTSKLIEEEERETGKVGLHVYKQYCTAAFGWWGVIAALLLSIIWQVSLMAGDYWLAYETSEERSAVFPSMFITVYAIIAAISVVLLTMRAFFITIMGLKTAQIFFWGILNSILHAPMSFFDTTPSGRILSRERFSQENVNRVNANLRMDFHNNGSNEWLGFRLELIGSFVLCMSAMFLIVLPSSIIRPENVGLSLSYGLSLNGVLFWAIYMSCFVENRMVSVERIKQFTNIPSEAAWEITDRVPPPSWPAHGNVDLKDLQSLERCQLKDVVAAKPEKLDASVVENGDNWSVGQRQLLCLGRVMLKRSRLLFMDEATASVDSKTDGVIQKIIREDFAACTIISIAHRIPTVMDCDRVLVIDAGWAKEFDKPSHLLERPSLFGALVQEYANRSAGL
ncbi:hypothetical protein GH714_023528 [Hevea brasiliensis]|uniref:ABC-type xenobiotic transporter n=1 Tax=Hevea brasiliensis TaxID=3981 RepID=A0A6A6LAE6_HEVBR|nr:hypothetical protein GH714_023528 [Hevea brasiliensis]